MKAQVRPWYRQRWPWLIMSGPALVVVASIYTAMLAVRSDDGLVADDYYTEGLAINKDIQRDAIAAARNIRGEAAFGPAGEVSLHLTGAIGDEIQVARRFGMQHSVQRRDARCADRTRRQPNHAISIVRIVAIQLRSQDRMVQHATPVARHEHDRRVRLQFHPDPQPV